MGILFSDDFESGDFSAWDSTSVTAPSCLEVTEEAARYGLFGCLAEDQADGVSFVKTTSTSREVWLRFYAKVTALTGNEGDEGGFWQQKKSDNTRHLVILRIKKTASGQGIYLRLVDDAGGFHDTPATPIPIELNRWYCFELHVKAAANPGDNDGGAALYVDGELAVSKFDIDNDLTNAGRTVCKCSWPGSQFAILRDQIVVATERIYPWRGYRIYHNTGAGTIDYDTVRAVKSDCDPSWTSPALAYPATWRFAARSYNENGEERNVDLVREVTLLDSGDESPARPNRPADLCAQAEAGGKVQVSFTYDATDEEATCTHFHVCCDGGSGEVDYESPLGSVAVDDGPSTRYTFLSGALTHGVTYRFAVRAATADDVEDDGTDWIEAVPDSQAPDQPATLSGEVVR